MKKTLLLAMSVLVFSFTSAFSHAQTFSVLYNFGAQANDPYMPGDPGLLAQGQDGNLHGSATSGGASTAGAAYVVTPAGSFTRIYDFLYGTGGYPYSGLTLGTDGNYYGSTFNTSAIFRLTPQGGYTAIASPVAGTQGQNPQAPPIQGTDGNFYGTITSGGANNDGTIYKITPSGTFSVLYTCAASDCSGPYAPLAQGTDGNFYGTSQYGGTNGSGSIFKITPAGKLTVLHSFNGTDGSDPVAPLLVGKDHNLYGTTHNGGTFTYYGTIFKITPAGVFSVLHNMNGSTDGAYLDAGLVQATDGNFYGLGVNGGSVNGYGSLFKITPAGVFTALYNFDISTGAYPRTTLLQHTNGLLYGTTQSGGSGSLASCSPGSCGVIYSVNIGAAPFVTFAGAAVAKVGKTVEILGQGFTGTTSVSFGTAAASYTVVSDNYLTATVPNGATTAVVSVKTAGGRLTSNRVFRVTPQVTSFSPSSGPVGTVVTITGVSLTKATRVTFGGIAATAYTVNSDTQITATAPTGALTGKIAVTTAGGAAASAASFTVN